MPVSPFEIVCLLHWGLEEHVLPPSLPNAPVNRMLTWVGVVLSPFMGQELGEGLRSEAAWPASPGAASGVLEQFFPHSETRTQKLKCGGVDSWKALGLGGQDWCRARRAMEETLSIGGGQRRRAGSRRDCGAEEEDWGAQWCQQGQHPTGAHLCPGPELVQGHNGKPTQAGTLPSH